jgi:uncharacterized SAM-binding protein YcdF (DUF218 family)
MQTSEGKARRRKRLLGAIAVGTASFVLAVAAGWPVYVQPQIDPLRRADAILILGGPHYARYPFGLRLADEGWAPNVMISNPNGDRDPWLTKFCAEPHREFNLYCFSPDPSTTRGEGRELRRLASEHGWRNVIVITYLPHVSRARMILERCFDGELIMTSSSTPASPLRWAVDYVTQTAGYVRAWLQPGC